MLNGPCAAPRRLCSTQQSQLAALAHLSPGESPQVEPVPNGSAVHAPTAVRSPYIFCNVCDYQWQLLEPTVCIARPWVRQVSLSPH